ncbi:MAG TPA: sel1 repeat family protein [Gammaproteobacteria bacterium]|nr:sel1 repeat family protein [Gammaproteobacteria bacterium]
MFVRNPLKKISLALALAVPCFPVYAGVEEGAKAIQKGQFEEAFSEWRPLAEKGESTVQAAIGVMYHAGQGVPQDYKKAFQWYRRAAENGNAASQANLGVMYAKGVGVEENLVQAYVWFDLAAMKGDAGYGRSRDRLAKLLNSEQLAQAKRVSREYATKYVTPFRKAGP